MTNCRWSGGRVLLHLFMWAAAVCLAAVGLVAASALYLNCSTIDVSAARRTAAGCMGVNEECLACVGGGKRCYPMVAFEYVGDGDIVELLRDDGYYVSSRFVPMYAERIRLAYMLKCYGLPFTLTEDAELLESVTVHDEVVYVFHDGKHMLVLFQCAPEYW